MRNKRFGKLLSAALAAAMALSLSSAALAAGNGETHLTIIGTSDTHGNIWGYSYEDMKESTGDGLARESTYVNQVRSENPNTILVDAGDTIQGTIMTDDLYSKDTASHPVAAALNYMDYDAWTLGNHEFNFGVDTLKSILEQVDMPVLAANIKNADGSYFTGAGYTIVERGGVKVAIIGVTTPNIPRWDGTKQGVADLTFEPMADAVAACIQAIGGKADVIMVSTHAGLGAEYSADGSDAAQTILDKCPEVDVLQLGHTHTTYINSAPIPVGEAKNNAGEVVRYDLTLNADKEITSATVETVSMAGIEPDQGLRELPAVKSAQEKTVSFTLSKRAFAYYRTDIADWYAESGDYVIMAAKSSRDVACTATVRVTSTTEIKRVYTMNSTVEEIMESPVGREFIGKMIASSGPSDASEGPNLGEGTAQMMEIMMREMPLRSLLAFGGENVPAGLGEMLLSQLNA